MSLYHIPVLLQESIDLLEVDPNGTYVDVTFGGGGHSREILKRLENGKLIAFDQDPDVRENIVEDKRFEFVPENFEFIEKILVSRNLLPVDGIIADLGISSHQIDTPLRGFSYRFEGPLDMRMNPDKELTASMILNEANESRLLYIFRTYGEIPNAKKLVRFIVREREGEKILHTHQLESIIQECIPRNRKAKYLAQVYQALRMEVNRELEVLETLLRTSLDLLRPGGRIAIIAYHSLEDRMVKHFLRSGNFSGIQQKDFYGNVITPWKLITRKAIQASEEEIAINSRARSARLRVAMKVL